MTRDDAFNVFNYYSHLLPHKEKLLFSHNTSGTAYINMDAWNKRVEIYFRNETLKNDAEIAGFIHLGYEAFIIKCAEWLLKSYPDKVVIDFCSRCPKCNGQTRTPRAKQCPHCFYSWH